MRLLDIEVWEERAEAADVAGEVDRGVEMSEWVILRTNDAMREMWAVDEKKNWRRGTMWLDQEKQSCLKG